MFRSNITSPVKSREKPFTVIVEGNIGSGKTTFLDYFQNHENEVCVLSEPVSMWQNCAGNNLLVKYTYTYLYKFKKYTL